MNKKAIFAAIIEAIELDLRRAVLANEQASQGATHAESRAETKWDTCGLEASYLARGYAMQFETLAKQLEELKALKIQDFSGRDIDLGALIEVEMNGESDLYYLLNCGGGTEVQHEGRTITVITPESPIGQLLVGGAKAGHFSLRAGHEGRILNIW
jgi:hypothetical protein